ncbi:helix-turn-helix transcriptional regulator [Schinkia azotoformans]|uniref:helix-turn-helix domain-containing protein n=1 Tax=Schinkia azotoformans TaxID=1454 RepID=UPI002DB93186|nr:helix-turn-helix transcriptional regulator [Schinkia azotoformans]MEC1778424.1 helix-turn-helix transcriptional regulator [Schinkia azotoformans]MED4328331.1 helix-turn-helix transcriptional regulator [Schinkia azotoformans]
MIGLEYLVKELNITFKDVANKLQISPKTINDWVKGRRKIPEQRKNELCRLFGGIPPELFQNEVTEENKKEIDYLIALHRHDTIIDTIENKMVFKQQTSADISNLIISLFWKMMLEGIDNPKLGLKVHTLKRVLDLLIAEVDEDIVDVLWETIDNIAGAPDEYMDELGALNMKYLDE